MKIAICDDDKQELLRINQYVNEFMNCNFAKEAIEVLSFGNSIELITQIEGGEHFDIFLLDVIMPNINGIELATEIRRGDTIAKIIFLTSSSEFAVKSYSVGAFHYLLKPIEKEALFCVLDKACNDICSTMKQYILVKNQNGISKIFFHEMIYVEVIGRTIYFHQKNGIVFKSNNSISQIEETLLKDSRFVKPHRSYIVNLDYVKTLTNYNFLMTSNQCIPVSRNVFKEAKQAFMDYLS